MGKADALTCSITSEVSDVKDNQDQIILIFRSFHSIASTTAIARFNTLENYI